jgi:DNA-binding NarL/FixJ family response regulator
MLLVDWALLPIDEDSQALANLRAICSNKIVIVLISHLEIRQQAAVSIGADAFISRSDTPDRVALNLRLAVAKVHPI